MTECLNPGPGPGPGPMPPAASAAMTQLYLCEESYWSKYDRSEICPHALQINVISDGKDGRRTVLLIDVEVAQNEGRTFS